MSLARLAPLALCAALAVYAAPALAQRTVSGDLQTQMSPQEFKAAGLDKLSPQELAALNDWLQGKVAKETAVALEKAKEEGRREVITKNRGFFDFGSAEPIESTLVGEFSGFAKGRHYVLANGQEWEQTEAASLASVHRTAPKVKITPGIMGVWYMQIDNYNTRAKVRRVK
ncbi:MULTISPECIES: hypothetical protein [unclassified Xanthomonas]|uniref:hypothetical protein n=1 Tax=unclassified Xanthomonas TaxID=2643310 RepID=UPI00136913D1|nr:MULTISPECIES: hypothetical protein [unclassified Xanthomonas]MBB6367919.1 hypothetical protein [Xanthomonas sp. F10]MXV32663.1 hypothetical protein [Xanthomonas sp. LMG 8989]UYC13330.1 hypothetical protein NUG21_06200 [Xanthomonas sp. CFBP 8445]